MSLSSRWSLRVLVLLAVGLAGCQKQLMPTPNIYVDGRYPLFENLPDEFQTNTVDLLYVTDRAPVNRPDGTLGYGYRRSPSLAFGHCIVEFGRNVDWETIKADSMRSKRSTKYPLRVKRIEETGRLAPTPIPLVERNGTLIDDPQAVASQMELAHRFQDEVRRRLAQVSSKNVYIFVHGYNNTFDYAAYVLAEFWHFGGRNGVPILYTWPAGSPGLLKGYTHDRESGEFTIFHLKKFIAALAQVDEIERIHIIAHSRGTDVAMSALRELLIEERGAGRLARETLKIGKVILASPDMDLEVTGQRFGAERFHNAYDHLTIYVSSKDKAIGLAESLFRSKARLGRVRPEDLSEAHRAGLAQIGRVDIVDARVKTGFLGHGYFHSNPAVSSDLLLFLRQGFDAGSPQRPMREAAPHFWVIDDESYPFVETD
jgi:esterase/lipase superfamily enzyme